MADDQLMCATCGVGLHPVELLKLATFWAGTDGNILCGDPNRHRDSHIPTKMIDLHDSEELEQWLAS